MWSYLIMMRGFTKVAACPLLIAAVPIFVLSASPRAEDTLLWLLIGLYGLALTRLHRLFASGLRDMETVNGPF